MPTIFSKIVAGEIPCYKIYEDEKFLAFLDINPLAQGHTLVIPKQEIDYFFDINDSMLSEMMLVAKRIAISLKKTIECKKVGVIVIGDEVPHAHIHLIPFQNPSKMSFTSPKLKLISEQLIEIQQKIISNL